MKKLFSIFLLVVLLICSFSSCNQSLYGLSSEANESNQKVIEDTQTFYDKVSENKKLLDAVATDVCTVWKDAHYSLSTEQINKKIQKELSNNQKKLDKITNANNEIDALFYNIKRGYASQQVNKVMNYYLEYYDSIINANAALNSAGDIIISSNKNFLDSALRSLYLVL